MKKIKKESSSESPPSFLSLPHDIVFNTLARIPRTSYPILYLVSKSFRSLLASPGLEAARSLIGRPEKYLHVCLNLNNKRNPNPRWFILSQGELIPTSSFPYKHLKSSSVVSTGSCTYIIGGEIVVNGRKKGSKRVFLIDCKTHQWRKLPNMRLSRKQAVVKVMDGKIYVIGGCSSEYSTKDENYGEVYDPNTQTWEPTTPNLRSKKGYYSSKICFLDSDSFCSTRLSSVELEKKLWFVVRDGELRCGGLSWWTTVRGLKAILSSNDLISVTNSGQDRRVIVWWKTSYNAEECETEIWCAQILIGIWDQKTVNGFIEWSQSAFTFQGCHRDSEFILHSALVTHAY
ncbi:putative F-box/kelch-repeat protein At2g44030 [Raphanus sativus]|uniref:F-box/kelch-repeat protein At2g44030 n=1 Tax=Raphanus sativus TaxID=3726 RepID=A0A6J0K6D8_RAPSA|nr:putative F-box/kelch-repeat protein At2g44030 [Raphanus sativus]